MEESWWEKWVVLIGTVLIVIAGTAFVAYTAYMKGH